MSSEFSNSGTVDPLLDQTMELPHALDNLGSPCTFIWCLGHVSTEGNEKADAETKQDANRPQVDPIAIRADDAKILATTSIFNVCRRSGMGGRANFLL